MGPNEFWVQKYKSEKNFGSKIILGQKKVKVQKILGPKQHHLCVIIRFLVCSVIVDFGVVLLVLLVTWVIWTPKLSQKPMIGLMCQISAF